MSKIKNTRNLDNQGGNLSGSTTNEHILLKVEEASALMGIGRNTMLKLAKMPGFPAIIFDHKIRIDKNQLPIWISKNYGRFRL